MKEIVNEDFIQNIINEYKNLNIYDINKCINISLTEYFNAKEAFFIKNKIFIKMNKNFQEMNLNAISQKRLENKVKKNLILLNSINNTNSRKKSIFQKGKTIFYGSIDTINEEFIMYSIYYNSKLLQNIKGILSMKNVKENSAIIKKNNNNKYLSITIDPFSINLFEGIYLFNVELINKDIVKHELSLIFKEINTNLKNLLKFDIKYFFDKKNIVIIKVNKKIIKELMQVIALKFENKTGFKLKILF